MLKTILIIVGAVLALGGLIYLLRRRKEYGPRIHRLPLRLMGYPHMPGAPFVLTEIPGTLIKLGLRANATTQAKWGMSNFYKIGAFDANGYSFLYGRDLQDSHVAETADREALLAELQESTSEAEISPEKLQQRFTQYAEAATSAGRDPILGTVLQTPEQFALSWTTFNAVYDDALPLLPTFAGTLSDPATANREFWPMIARHGLAYNLLILVKVDAARAADYQAALGEAWTPELQSLQMAGRLFAIDLRLFESLPASTVHDLDRFTPATLTLLGQDASTKALTPLKVLVSGQKGAGKQVFGYQDGVTTDGAWLYALQAAKTSITLYGIWIGHVYHWHIVSAALVMTLRNNVPESHPLRVMMDPQTNYLIPFNDVLLLLWKHIAPPTSIATTPQFLALMDQFGNGRTYFQDDPDVTLRDNGITVDDFTVDTPWDQYPIAGHLLDIFQYAGDYVQGVVPQIWASNRAVAEDNDIKAWVAATIDPRDGNITGFPSIDDQATLIAALKSWVFRLSVHGVSRLNHIANPVLSFVPNFPPCLQISAIPAPNTVITTTQLMAYLPVTGTIGEMITFLFTFVFSAPYEPFLPLSGNATDLIWGDNPEDPRNKALIQFRDRIEGFIDATAHPTQRYQWPRNIET
jgi:hypothetical protein